MTTEQIKPREQVRRLRHVADAVLREYGISDVSFSFLKDCKQPAFRVQKSRTGRAPDGGGAYRQRTFLLRMYRAENGKPSLVRSELLWLRAILADTQIVVPEPVANRHGDLVTKHSTFHCALTRWVDGRFYLRKNGPGPTALRKVGRMMALIHLHGQRFKRPRGFRCHRWNWDGVFGAKSPYFPNAEREILRQEDRRLFALVTRRSQRVMEQLGTGRDVFGLFHADLIQVNYLFHRGEVRAIDFGDFGYAHYLYDMGVTLFALWGRDDDLRQRQAFLEGYREVRCFLPEHEQLLDLFIAVRGVSLARLVMGSDEHIKGIGMEYVRKVLAGIRLWIDPC